MFNDNNQLKILGTIRAKRPAAGYTETMIYNGMYERHSTEDFTWDSDTGTLSADASELGWTPGQRPNLVEVQSSRSGTIGTFRLHLTRRHGEDVVSWVYATHDGLPIGRAFFVEVFND